MFDLDRWTEIYTSIRKNWLRTLLSGFTVSLGLFIFITLFGMGKGLENSFQQEFLKGSANSIFIYSDFTSMAYNGLQSNRKIQFKNETFDFIKNEYGDKLQYITAALYDQVKASYKQESGSYTIRAIHPERQLIEKNELLKGRFLNQSDVRNKTKNINIGRMIEKDLFGHENAIGKHLNLNGINYLVIGVFSDEGGDDEERIIYLPITTQQQIKSGTNKIDEIILGYHPDKADEAILLSEELKTKLKKNLQIHPDDEQAIYINNMAEAASSNLLFLFVIGIIVMVIGAGTLIAGMMGIFNIMVYSVKERTKELGVRKALGAPPNSIVFLVLSESVVITLLSGIAGIAAGMLFLKSIGNTLEEYFILNPSVNIGLVIFALFCLVIAGFVAGLIPSYRASRIKPIEALRSD